jgi:hypothetical protein
VIPLLGHHQVGEPPARLAPGGDDRRRYPAVDAGRLGVERNRVELALGTLQDLQAPCPLGVIDADTLAYTVLRQQLERVSVTWPDNAEVAAVECGDPGCATPLG